MTVSAASPVLRVTDIDVAGRFHVHALGCTPVRSTDDRVELELCGQPLTLVVDPSLAGVDAAGDTAAFVLGVDDWCTTSERLRAHGVDVAVEPARRFSVVPGEQCAMRVADPDGNVVELRGFAAEADLLAA